MIVVAVVIVFFLLSFSSTWFFLFILSHVQSWKWFVLFCLALCWTYYSWFETIWFVFERRCARCRKIHWNWICAITHVLRTENWSKHRKTPISIFETFANIFCVTNFFVSVIWLVVVASFCFILWFSLNAIWSTFNIVIATVYIETFK